MNLVYHMNNQELIERFMASPYFNEWSDGGVQMQEALDKFITDPKGLGCTDYDKDGFISLQIMANSMCQKKQRLMQYESE